MARARAVVKLGIPALIVAVLAVVALWRVEPPPPKSAAIGTSGAGPAKVLTVPLTKLADLFANNAVGREASLEHAYVRERVNDRCLWIGSGDERPIFAVLDPDVKTSGTVDLKAGRTVTLIGIVRPAPSAAKASEDWHLSPATGTLVEESGTYLHVTEVRE